MIDHLKYITKKTKPLDALDFYIQLNDKNIHSELIKQDVLILSSENDHLVPVKMHNLQIDALVNAKSVVGKVFTVGENAQNHCQTGNIKLSLDYMIEWIKSHSK